MSMIRNVKIKLGPREVVVAGKVRAICDDIDVDVAEITAEELEALETAPVILLVKPIPERISQEVPHEG